MIVDVAEDELPRDGGDVRLFLIIPGPMGVTGQLELVVERFGLGRWHRLGFVTRCQSDQAMDCDLGAKLPPAVGYFPRGSRVPQNRPGVGGPQSLAMVLRFKTIPAGRYGFHAEVTRGGGNLVGKVLSNRFEIGVGAATKWPGVQPVDKLVSASAASVPYFGSFQRWDPETRSWIELPNVLTTTGTQSQIQGQRRGLHRSCSAPETCVGIWLSEQIAPNTPPINQYGYRGTRVVY